MNHTRSLRSVLTMLFALIASVLLAMSLVSCGESSSSKESSEAQSTAAAEGAFPVTVKHKFGETTIDSMPKRVVSLGYSDQEPIIAFGVTPVLVREWSGMTPEGQGVSEWAKDKIEGDKIELYKGKDIDPEVIATYQPDLIVAISSGMSKDDYEALSKIAPVVAQTADYPDYQQPWDVTTKQIGTALGQADKADEMIKDIKDRSAALAKKHPEWQGKSIVVGGYDGEDLWVYTQDDPRARFFRDLGFKYNQKVQDLAGEKFNVKLSLEQADVLESDVIIWYQISSNKDGIDTIRNESALAALPAQKEERSVYLTGELERSFGWQTVLSLDYLLDHIEEPLAKAASK